MPTSEQVIKHIEAGLYDDTFCRLYGPGEQQAAHQRARYAKAVREFEENYGNGREVSLYSTSGRTEICGNHTDHNHGLVLAAAVNLDIIAVVAKNQDGYARVKSEGFPGRDAVDLAYLMPENQEFGQSSALIRGVAAGIKKRGGLAEGFDAYTTSDVLRGSGLSSSAAFEVCLAGIWNEEYNQGRFLPLELAQIGQYAENTFFGKPSGLMDQTACAVGGAIAIDFENPVQPDVRQVPLAPAAQGHVLVITDTGGSHAALTDEYAAVRHEMAQVARVFGKKVLREVPQDAFMERLPEVRRKTGDRAVLRALHFYEECRRVGEMAKALEKNDFSEFLRLVCESGHSSFEYNQNAFSHANVREQGVPLGLALSQLVLGGQGAFRLQGGGFAGTIQAFVPDALLEAYCAELTRVFGPDACHALSVREQGFVPVHAHAG